MSRKQTSGLRFQSAREPANRGLPVGKKQQLNIERIAHDGRGIALVQQRTWFVAGALPDEQVTARVLTSKGKTVDAQVISVEQASAQREQVFCTYAGNCGGCTLQHMPQAMQRDFKQEYLLNQLERAGVSTPELEPMLMAPPDGYRRRARLAVRVNKAGKLELGFRALASQRIVEITECPILVAPLQQLLQQLPSVISKIKTPRALGHLELFFGNQVALLVRLNAPLPAVDVQLFIEFCHQQQIQLWWQDKEHPRPQQSGQNLFYTLPAYGLEIDYQPGDFVQVNAELNQQMVEQALAWLQPQTTDTVLDLFCGLGNFSLPLAQKVAKVSAVEGVASMVERARNCAKRQGIDNVEFYQHDLNSDVHKASWARQYDLLLLDPPRDGARSLVGQLEPFAARKVLYVSCNPATLARDAAVIQQQGYQLQRLSALDMFSQTGHVEAMALFELRSK